MTPSFLGGYYRDYRDYRDQHQTGPEKFSLRWSGQRLIQRLSSLRQSVRQRGRKLQVSSPPAPAPETNPDQDRVYFRGFSGVSAHPTAPPRRRKSSSKLTRSLSLNSSRDVIRGRPGGLARIEELYPDCPRTPIYAVVDLTKKRKRERESNLPDLVTRGVSQSPDHTPHLTDTTEEKTNKMVKSHSANHSPTNGELLLDNEIVPAKTKSGHKKRKHKKKREEAEHGVTFTGHKGKRPGMEI